MSPAYDFRDLIATMADHEARANHHRPTDADVLLREVMRLRALGRTPDDIGTLLGINPADAYVLIYGTDEPGTA